MKFYSKEWFTELQRLTKEDAEYKKNTEGLTWKGEFVVTDSPDGTDKYIALDMKDGEIINVSVEEKPAPSDFRVMPYDPKAYLIRTTGAYDTFTKIQKKEMGPMAAIMSKQYKIEGNMMKMMQMMVPMAAFTDLQALIPTEF